MLAGGFSQRQAKPQAARRSGQSRQPAARAALTGQIGFVLDRAQHIHDTVETHMSASGSGLRLPRVPLREAWMITGVEEK